MEYTVKELELMQYAISVCIGELGSNTESLEKSLEALHDKIQEDKQGKQNVR